MIIDPPLEEVFAPTNVANGWNRPTFGPNAWVAALDDELPMLTLKWAGETTIASIDLVFDTENGVVGWGETYRILAPQATALIIRDVAGVLVRGRDPHDVEPREAVLEQVAWT